jgi:ferredoxin-NADP reductase/Na+-translocating ferredoxin:NAD+ oxidoreductase RnfD subunit
MNTLLRPVDRILNTITMYRLMLYVLIVLVLVAALFGGIGLLPFNPLYILASAAFLVALSVLANWGFARIFRAPTNVESTFITALILALIINPDPPGSSLVTLAVAAVAATASKYLLAFRRRHIFNPAAIAVVITSYALGLPATWWVSAPVLLPFVFVGGVLVVRKIRRLDLVGTFFLTYFVALLAFAIAQRVDLATQVRQTLLLTPLLFLAFVMLTEPLTMPPTRRLRMVFGALVGFLIVPQVHIGGFYFSPEVALVVGNVFAWVVSAKATQMLLLKERRAVSGQAEEFVFRQEHPVRFRPGQYLDWTLPHDHSDSRGDRRYFTISSPPSDDALAIGVEFKDRPSSFKKRLKAMEPGERIAAGHLAGDFVMPRDPQEKLAFVAGGIGVTPFVSMIRDLLQRGEKRDIVVLVTNRYETGAAYRDVFEQARGELGIRTIFTLTGPADALPPDWTGRTGRIDERFLREEIPDCQERVFFICGSQRLVGGIKEVLAGLGIERSSVRSDFFPGLA